MIIKKKLNNNAVIAFGQDGIDQILTGKGIGFMKNRGDKVDQERLEKRYKLSTAERQNKLISIVGTIPLQYLDFTDRIVKKLSIKLNETFDDNIYIALTDHIYFTVSRYRNHESVNTSLLWEVKDIYPKIYQQSLKILQEINKEFNVDLTVDEARLLTFHIADNLKTNEQNFDVGDSIKMVTDMLNIVKYYFNIEYDKNSLEYTRFIIHLKFLTKRILGKEKQTSEAVFFYSELPQKMPEAFKCMQKIKEYILKTQNFDLSIGEQSYLTIHIQRIILNHK
ncbi:MULTISPECIES: PRD domain-containing protein [unclassified Lactobacillus]|uniref:PRD domain-containing protein n=1 Tax=unclassified Lactobacillus TaxID=2620435 RepID=UPI000EFB7A88|nr:MULTISPECIES: PRD domain-containing protein [unclassified Lactobacillus]RMC38624.1 PRD domain-containing protein [Lactobacillus sp. ESL0237]RMC42969.1 PRD domain-containing protein [Lactobacillus sp. ESL0234]RMC43823.1 PRD domain-containing protein [Lactobacillus sp. ESL0236]RMC48072.1 PRD domain-containing protein [Lactobacillus sp. ESL0225]